MKEGWTYKKLGEVATYHKEQGNFHDLPYVGMEHIESGSGKLLGTISSNNVLSSSFKFNKGEVLYGRLRPYLKKVFVAEFDGCCSTEVFPIYSDCIEPGFIKYWFLSDKITNMVNQTSAGCRMPRGNMNDVKQFIIGYPANRQEQQRIVSRLDSAFAHIDERKVNAEKQLSEARALFQKALTKAMEPKEGWEEKKLEDLCTDIVDCPHSTPRKVDHPTKYPCIRTSELKGGKIEWESMQYLDEDEYIVRTARIKPQPNDIVYGREGTYGDAVLLPEGYYFSLGQRTMLFRPDVRCVEPKYLHYNVISSHVYEQAKAKNSGCGVGHVNVKDIKVFKIGVPPLSEQQRIVSRLDSLSAHVRELEEVLQKTIAECDALKQALLRQVFE